MRLRRATSATPQQSRASSCASPSSPSAHHKRRHNNESSTESGTESGTEAVDAEFNAQHAAPVERLGFELFAVLAVTFGLDGLNSLIGLIRTQLTYKQVGLGGLQTAPIKSADTSVPQWFDFLAQLLSAATGLAPAVLAIALLTRNPAGRGYGIGLTRPRAREFAAGAGFAALIGLPGLGLVYAATELGFNATVVVTSFPDVWYRVPVLLAQAFQQGLSEEVVVAGYLLTRLRQIGWSDRRALALGAVVRGSYHLYQGYGAFVGNAVMGVIFGWWFQRTRRVWPLVLAHAFIDAVSFVGYIYLHDKVSWI